MLAIASANLARYERARHSDNHTSGLMTFPVLLLVSGNPAAQRTACIQNLHPQVFNFKLHNGRIELMKSRLINVGFNEFRHIRFWALSIVLCGLLIGAFIPAFKVIGMVTVTDEGLYTRCEDSQPFRRIGPERITIPGLAIY